VLKKSEGGASEISFDFENVEAQVVKDVKCPVCGGEIVKTSFGYGCRNYNREDPAQGCNFNIGTVAGHKFKDAEVKELLTNGVTPVISGFKSKSGKPFDARITLGKDESGKVTGLKFVFENQDEVMEGLKCPVCGKQIIKGHNGYRCEDYKKEEGGCSFFVGKVAGLELPKEVFTQLVTDKITDTVSGFTSKKGSTFDAKLAFDENYRVVFKFE
jgi:DNA topoisomerase-3